jgi:hypothetical protein
MSEHEKSLSMHEFNQLTETPAKVAELEARVLIEAGRADLAAGRIRRGVEEMYELRERIRANQAKPATAAAPAPAPAPADTPTPMATPEPTAPAVDPIRPLAAPGTPTPMLAPVSTEQEPGESLGGFWMRRAATTRAATIAGSNPQIDMKRPFGLGRVR